MHTLNAMQVPLNNSVFQIINVYAFKIKMCPWYKRWMERLKESTLKFKPENTIKNKSQKRQHYNNLAIAYLMLRGISHRLCVWNYMTPSKYSAAFQWRWDRKIAHSKKMFFFSVSEENNSSCGLLKKKTQRKVSTKQKRDCVCGRCLAPSSGETQSDIYCGQV